MNTLPRIRRFGRPLLLGLAVVLLPALANAETLTIRNDTSTTLVVQAACVVNGGVRRDRPVPIKAGGSVTINLPGNKLINVYDARLPNRVLHQSTITSSKDDATYAIQADKAGKMQLEPVKDEKPRKRPE
jgi:hypothetical protein